MTIKDSFNSRKNYDNEIIPMNDDLFLDLYSKYYIDSWNVIPLYGKVDSFGIPIVPKQDLVDFCSYSKDEKPIRAIQPMAFFFDSLRSQYLNYYSAGAINKNSKFFKKDLIPIKGYINPDRELTKNLKQTYLNFANYQTLNSNSELAGLWSTNTNNKIKNFDQFFQELLNYLSFTRKYFTRSGYVESTDFSLLHTGLAVEIYDGSPDNEQERIDFVKDTNFPIFLELCLRNNLKIDREIPWRVYCDVRTKPNPKNTKFEHLDFYSTIKNYIPHYKQIQDFFDFYYARAMPYDDISFVYFQEFINILDAFYLSFIKSFPTFNLYYLDKCNNADVVKQKRENMPTFEYKDYLKFYIKIRNIELSEVVDKSQLDKIYFQSLKSYDYFYKTHGVEKAVISVIKFYTNKIGTLAYRNPSLYELDEKSKMP